MKSGDEIDMHQKFTDCAIKIQTSLLVVTASSSFG
jgi:hypothetical protein